MTTSTPSTTTPAPAPAPAETRRRFTIGGQRFGIDLNDLFADSSTDQASQNNFRITQFNPSRGAVLGYRQQPSAAYITAVSGRATPETEESTTPAPAPTPTPTPTPAPAPAPAPAPSAGTPPPQRAQTPTPNTPFVPAPGEMPQGQGIPTQYGQDAYYFGDEDYTAARRAGYDNASILGWLGGNPDRLSSGNREGVAGGLYERIRGAGSGDATQAPAPAPAPVDNRPPISAALGGDPNWFGDADYDIARARGWSPREIYSWLSANRGVLRGTHVPGGGGVFDRARRDAGQ